MLIFIVCISVPIRLIGIGYSCLGIFNLIIADLVAILVSHILFYAHYSPISIFVHYSLIPLFLLLQLLYILMLFGSI